MQSLLYAYKKRRGGPGRKRVRFFHDLNVFSLFFEIYYCCSNQKQQFTGENMMRGPNVMPVAGGWFDPRATAKKKVSHCDVRSLRVPQRSVITSRAVWRVFYSCVINNNNNIMLCITANFHSDFYPTNGFIRLGTVTHANRKSLARKTNHALK